MHTTLEFRGRAMVMAALLACLLAMPAMPLLAEDDDDDSEGPKTLQILGWVEDAYLMEPGFALKAKLDTGARTSSLDARIIKRFRQYGKRWVRFAVIDEATGKEHVLVRERERTIGIVQHEGENEIRPTVKIEACIAGIEREIEVSLVDRENFTYPLLLGRRTLRHIAVVHPGETYLSEAKCVDEEGELEEDVRKPSTEESPGEEEDDERSVDETERAGEDELAGNEDEEDDDHRDDDEEPDGDDNDNDQD